jgi:thiamine-phosphate pyrophosphorylase
MRDRSRQLPRLNAILDDDVARAAKWTVPDVARACLAGGARFLQVRAKQASGREYLALCSEVIALASDHDAIVIVNDRADIARLCGASGVHVGQEDVPPVAVRVVIGNTLLLGLSTHTAEQVRHALSQPIDYFAVGPVFRTSTKATGHTAVGVEFVQQASAAAMAAAAKAGDSPLPVVAIGGITLDRARVLVDAGAAAVAVISDLLTTGDPESRVRSYLDAIGV